MLRGPRAHLDASELCDIDKHHHEVATGHLPKAKVGKKGNEGQIIDRERGMKRGGEERTKTTV